MRQGQLELQAHLPCRVIGDTPVRPHVGTQEALGTAQSGRRAVIRKRFLERVAFKLRTRRWIKASQVQHAALAHSTCSLQTNRELDLERWEVPPAHLDSAPTSLQAESVMWELMNKQAIMPILLTNPLRLQQPSQQLVGTQRGRAHDTKCTSTQRGKIQEWGSGTPRTAIHPTSIFCASGTMRSALYGTVSFLS